MYVADHLGILTKDTKTSKDFYCNVLDCKYIRSYRDEIRELTFLKSGNTVIELVYKNNFDFNELDGTVNHLAFKVNDIRRAIEELKEKGVKFQSDTPVLLDEKYIVFFWGPFGEKLELVQEI